MYAYTTVIICLHIYRSSFNQPKKLIPYILWLKMSLIESSIETDGWLRKWQFIYFLFHFNRFSPELLSRIIRFHIMSLGLSTTHPSTCLLLSHENFSQINICIFLCSAAGATFSVISQTKWVFFIPFLWYFTHILYIVPWCKST